MKEAVSAAQDWWRAAGVDCDFVDAPHNWLAEPLAKQAATKIEVAKKAKPLEAAPVRQIGGDPTGWPNSITEFDKWWLEEPSLSLESNALRPPPRGEHAAPLMILVPQPEADDQEVLLSGPQGTLIANMTRAMGFSIDDVRIASVLSRHTPAADWAAFAAAGIGQLTLHHIFLAAPQKLLVLGRAILPLLGADPKQAAALDSILSGNATIDTCAGRDPATLLAMAPARRALWHRWLERSFND